MSNTDTKIPESCSCFDGIILLFLGKIDKVKFFSIIDIPFGQHDRMLDMLKEHKKENPLFDHDGIAEQAILAKKAEALEIPLADLSRRINFQDFELNEKIRRKGFSFMWQLCEKTEGELLKTFDTSVFVSIRRILRSHNLQPGMYLSDEIRAKLPK